MGVDVKSLADNAVNSAQSVSLDSLWSALPSATALQPLSGPFLLIATGIAIGYIGKHTRIGQRASKTIEDTLFGNWRLGLLAATGLVLSLASGYTTWDGMRAFTGEPILSAMVTFGIQGVMLIVAWLIGESFATGMAHRPAKTHTTDLGFSPMTQRLVGLSVGVLLFVAVLALILQSTGQLDVRTTHDLSWTKLGDKLLIIAVGLLLAALVALYSASDLVLPYVQSTRVIVKNAVLWLMFLSCMATSVFFSFNSLFTVIFPQEQRVRAAELRAQNQVAGLIADIGQRISTTRLQEIEDFFNSDGWRSYDKQLDTLSAAAQGSSDEIRAYFQEQMEERNRAVKQQQERIATSQSGSAGLQSKKTSLVEELTRLKSERASLAEDFHRNKAELDTRSRALDAKRVEAMAEEKGAEGTLKAGRGPMYRQRMDELSTMQAAHKIQEDRVRDANKRLTSNDSRITQIERELATIDGDLAKLKGEAETADQRIKLLQDSQPADISTRVDPDRMLPAFETARAAFRQEPGKERLSAVQGLCSEIQTAMIRSEVTKKKVAGLDCDPKRATEAAAAVFALNEGAKNFKARCEGGDKLNEQKSADALFAFARKCLAESGLSSKETDATRAYVNSVELNRDDKAHPLVATLNAFGDGNKLAYLALFIAVSMDALVFMSGLFGANAVRSPLQDVPSIKPRTAQQLESIIETALLPDRYENARAVINALRPMTPVDGYTARIEILPHDPHAADIRRVLNAGASIGAVRHTDSDEYYVRSELFEFLSTVAKKAFDSDRRHVDMAELEKIVTVALLPDIGDNAQVVLDHMHPMSEDRGFTSVVHLSEIDGAHQRIVRNALNAGATLQVVQRYTTDQASYYIHGDFYKALARIRARSILTGPGAARLGGSPVQPALGGPLRAAPMGELPGAAARPSLAAPLHAATPPPATSVPEVGTPASLARDPEYLREFYRGELLTAIGLEPEVAIDRLASEDVIEATRDVRKALSTIGNARLKSLLLDYERRLAKTVAGTCASLMQDPNGDEEALRLARGDVESQLPTLLMFPEVGLLDYLIAELRAAAATDAGHASGEPLLLDMLTHIRAQMDQLDLHSEAAWRSIESVLLPSSDLPKMLRPGRGDDA